MGPTEENSMEKGMEKDGRGGTKEKGSGDRRKKVRDKGEQDSFIKEVARMFNGEEKLGDMEEEDDKMKECKKWEKGGKLKT